MLSRFVLPGNRVELQEIKQNDDVNAETGKKIYYSRVYDILGEDRMEIVMPLEKTKLVLLQVDEEYDMVNNGQVAFLRVDAFHLADLFDCTHI